MPRSLAIWACDLWLDCTNWTASTLNSLVNVRCSFCMIFSLPVSGSLFQVYLPLFSGSRPSSHPCHPSSHPCHPSPYPCHPSSHPCHPSPYPCHPERSEGSLHHLA